MPRIKSFETWVCRRERGPQYNAQGHKFSSADRVVLIKITDEDGFEGIGTCIGERSSSIPLAYLHDIIAPIVLGRDVHDREAIWHDLWKTYRPLGFYPIYVTGPVDVALWDLAAKRANLPLYKYIGAMRDSLPVYYSCQFMDTVDDYVQDVKRCLSMGLTAYKVHSKDNLDIFSAVRETAGPDLVLIADPVADWTVEHATRVGRHLETLNYYWLEEPFRDWDIEKYSRLCEILEIPIAGTETTEGASWGVAQSIIRRAVDIVRADVSWKSGVTGTLKIAHLAEAFGLNCELHSAMMGPMDMANLHVSCAMNNIEYFEWHMHEDQWRFPMKGPYDIDDKGVIHVPQGPGLGIEIDWDTVDKTTHQCLTFEAK